jgi:NAD(P)-dependent dehydrogenase (short-subunit alcohol dehydrogenase family)
VPVAEQKLNSEPVRSPKYVLVSGASTGIGEAVVNRLASQGWTVFAGIRKSTDARRLEQRNPQQVFPLYLDITKPDQIEQAVQQIRQMSGTTGLYGLVNNAGIAITGPLEFLDIEDIRLQMEVNYIGQAALTQACLPLLRLATGRMINISSISGRIAAPFFGPYAASKFALEAYSDALRLELHRWGLKVVLIEPGAIQTPIWEKSLAAAQERLEALPEQAHKLYGQDIERIIKRTSHAGENGLPAAAVADLVFHTLTTRNPRPRYFIGRGIRLGDFFNYLSPGKIRDWVFGKLTGFAD